MVIRCRIGPEQQGARLDLLLRELMPDLSRAKIRAIIDLGGVHIGGRRVRTCGLIPALNQRIEVHVDQQPLEPYRIEPSQILFQDEYLIALNKPVGINTQPTPARYKGTLYEALQVLLGRDRRFGRKLEIGMAQRLDRDTSGLLVFSIHTRAHKALTEQLQDRRVKKHYLALVPGAMEAVEGEYRSCLARDRRNNRVRSVPVGGKEAITRYRVLAVAEELSLVEVELVTGRMHQIRAHFAEAGHPLCGDGRYGGPSFVGKYRFSRHCLHSQRLELVHPVSGDALILEAPPPAELTDPFKATAPDMSHGAFPRF